MKITVSNVAQPLQSDIDSTAVVGALEVDSLVSTCITAAKDALANCPPVGFSDFERDQLAQVAECMRSSHLSIRKLLKDDKNPSGVDALVIARLQVESLYSLCFLIRDPQNVRLMMKNSWKKKYVRYLLEKEELKNLARFNSFYNEIAPFYLSQLRDVCFVTEDEQRTIESDELGTVLSPNNQRVNIAKFPTPGDVIAKTEAGTQLEMLRRLYPEYRFLCSFAHGDAESTLFRTAADSRSPMRHLLSEEQTEDFFQRQIRESALYYSVLSAIQAATEIAAICPTDIEVMVKVSNAWDRLRNFHLLCLRVWEIRAKHIFPLINSGQI